MVFLHFLLFSLLSLTAKCQDPLRLLPLEPPPTDQVPSAPAAVHVDPHHLQGISDSVLAAENWVRNHVLSHYPATNISTILVGSAVLCTENQRQNFALILPSLKNIHHSLTRWGLHHEIKVSTAFSSECLDPFSESYRDEVAKAYIKPLLAFLRGAASPYVVRPPQGFRASSEEISALQKSHLKSMKNLGIYETRRKLAYIDTSVSSNPAFAAGGPLPPLVGSFPPEWNPTSPPFLPHPPMGPHLPPCEPGRARRVRHGSWCVAKPSVPAETLQEALDYACGEGNVDCEAIKEDGSCFFPDNLVAHASYAFNSYWQATKKNGGTCGFGGTAMLISSDPSYGHCRFALT